MKQLMHHRFSKLRQNTAIRNMLAETRLNKHDFIVPLFINANITQKVAIKSMPNQFQLTLNDLATEIDEIVKLGLPAVILFGIPTYKDAHGSASLNDDGIIQQAIRLIRKHAPDLIVIADVCFCEYTDHGHCGALLAEKIDIKQTLALLAEQAISYAKAGAHMVAPSSMTDGMVLAIRQALDTANYLDTIILSYAVKYSSSLYNPFREAAMGAPLFGDRKTYQMNPANAHEAIKESAQDIAEGADIIMVKPAANYLDIIYQLKQKFSHIPLCAYQVSGEYAMIKHAAASGLIDEQAAMLESLIAIKRAGADLTISYFAKDLAKLL